MRNTTLDQQLRQHQAKRFDSLYSVFAKFAKGAQSERMDVRGLTKALEGFGMVIDTSPKLKQFVFATFDGDKRKRWIDYNDFAATMSSISPAVARNADRRPTPPPNISSGTGNSSTSVAAAESLWTQTGSPCACQDSTCGSGCVS